MSDSLIILFVAFLADLYLGDPVYPLHPVRLIGRLIRGCEVLLEHLHLFTLAGGVVLLISVISVVISVYASISLLLLDYLLIINGFLLYSCLSLKDLVKHGKRVLSDLENNHLEQARNSVQHLIGRDASRLDRYGIARAAVESLAENFVDGFLAPLFWFCLGSIASFALGFDATVGGILAVLIHKTVNTLDSMVGYKNARYQAFGKASARFDDLLNFLPARLSIPVIAVAAVLCGLDGKGAWKIGWRDRLKHNSPNAGHAEATVSGALQIRLNGPGIYPHGLVDKPWLGDGTDLVLTSHLRKTFTLVYTAAFIAAALFAGGMALI